MKLPRSVLAIAINQHARLDARSDRRRISRGSSRKEKEERGGWEREDEETRGVGRSTGALVLPLFLSRKQRGEKKLRDRACKSPDYRAREPGSCNRRVILSSRPFVCVTDVPPVIGDGQ